MTFAQVQAMMQVIFHFLMMLAGASYFEWETVPPRDSMDFDSALRARMRGLGAGRLRAFQMLRAWKSADFRRGIGMYLICICYRDLRGLFGWVLLASQRN